ncbi:hypothetical protein MMC09_001509 [Bachmanniomyces sp. S44760]|nr:hypothetical protein [Bachmanniomyces sp. S44760]
MGSDSALEKRRILTEKLSHDNPYDAELYLKRARCHEKLGFPDLAVGDAYKALLLTDEADDESGEYHERALEAIKKTTSRSLSCRNGGDEPTSSETESNPETADGSTAARIATYALTSYRLLAWNLWRCGSLKSAYDFCQRGLRLHDQDESLEECKKQILATNKVTRDRRDPTWVESNFDPRIDLSDEGSVRRELYPWNVHEPDRFSPSSLSFLNQELSTVAPKCTIRAVALPLLTEDGGLLNRMPQKEPKSILQLGLFAKEDIGPGETVLHESSILTANNRLHNPLCDACSSELPPISASHEIHACQECTDIVFCSEKCYTTAMKTYHPSICGSEDVDTIGKDTDPKEAANALYLLLLGRVLALSKTQNQHPLEIKETKYISGDFIAPSLSESSYLHSTSAASAFTVARHLPFSFTYNILSPLHLLEKMGVDVFSPHSLENYDVWIFNTLYAKFRATASARLSTRDGRPEVSAVHPLWCLANHSCAPNVRWEWGGEIKFWARGGREVVRWGEEKGEKDERKWEGGIKAGEEILNHYCDVELSVEERREWAVGALGGMCVCERCKWEDSTEKDQIDKHINGAYNRSNENKQIDR